MKKTLDFTFLFYIAVAMAFATKIPSIGVNSTVASISSGVLLFLEGVKAATYCVSLVMATWFLFSSKATVQKKEGSNFRIAHFKTSKQISFINFILLMFLLISADFPNQKQLVTLLVINAILNLAFKLVLNQSLKKAKQIINKENV